MAIPLRYNALSLVARPTSTISSVVLIAVVIFAFAYLQAVTDSAFQTMTGTGDPNTVIVLSQSAESESTSSLTKEDLNKLEMAADGQRVDGSLLVSAEAVGIASAFAHGDSEVAINTAVRGVDFDAATRVRHGDIRIIRGRAFQPGTYEVIVGAQMPRAYRGHDVGDEIELGDRGMRRFKVVGVFSSGGTAADSEIWGYVETLRDVYGGQGGYSSARLLVDDQQEARRLVDFLQGPAVGLLAKTEADYFRDLNTNLQATSVLSVVMIIIMGTASAFAVANTMYAAVAGRTREIGMLRAIGFGKTSLLTAFVAEGLLLSLLGGVLGSLLSLVCNGMQRSILPTTFTTVSYSLAITPKIVGVSLAVALTIGLAGSIFPAWRAARMGVTRALREP